jgi:hypothetical protein
MWLYNNEVFEDISDYIGFVYIITNLTNSRRYLGKKNFHFSKTRTIKGKKKRIKVESDWASYYGSNKELLADVEKLGKENFKREIIRLCSSKGEMSYFEALEQFNNKVLESDDWYNSYIMVRVHKKHLTYLKG